MSERDRDKWDRKYTERGRATRAAFVRELSPGGMLMFCHQTRRNLERHEKPPAAFLLDDGELPGLIAGLDIVSYDERWHEEGRHEARLVARERIPRAAKAAQQRSSYRRRRG